MALTLKINLCEHRACEKLYFHELTKAYNSLLNTTGYDEDDVILGIPPTSFAGTALLTIVTPGNVTYTFDLLAEGFPTTDDEKEFIITAAMLGYTDGKILDGIYTVTYTVIATDLENVDFAPGTFTVSKYFLMTCQAECCIDKLYAKIPDADCVDCKEEARKLAVEAEGFLTAAKKAIKCNKVKLAKKHLEKVKYLCTKENCNGC